MLLPDTFERSTQGAASLGRWSADIGRALLSVLIPQLCLGCEAVIGPEGHWLCTGCHERVAGSVRPRSRTIEIGADAGEPGESQSEQAGAYTLRIDYALDYNSVVSTLITELKYGDKPGLAGVLALFMNSALAGGVSRDTVVIPVPIRHSRRRERGYNQSELLAECMARARGLSLESGLLLKTRNTRSQTSLEREERMRSTVGSFGVRRGGRLSGRRVLLVDDVVTTGSTLRECARAVLKAGAREVSACVAASSS